MREGNGTAGTENLAGMPGRKHIYPYMCPHYTCAPYPQQVPFPLLSVQIDLLLCQRLGFMFVVVILGKEKNSRKNWA